MSTARDGSEGFTVHASSDGVEIERLDASEAVRLEVARRRGDHRRALLATPVYTIETLGELLGHSNPSTTRTWVSQKRSAKRLFTVTVDDQMIIPAFQLDAEGEPRKDLAVILDTLLSVGVDGWALWTWLVVGTPLLSGGVPSELVETEPERVQVAAERFADRHRSPA